MYVRCLNNLFWKGDRPYPLRKVLNLGLSVFKAISHKKDLKEAYANVRYRIPAKQPKSVSLSAMKYSQTLGAMFSVYIQR